MKFELEWRNASGLDVLIDQAGEIHATVRMTSEKLWIAKYGAVDPPRTFFTRDDARRAMINRYEETMTELAEKAKKKPKEPPKDKEKKDG